MLAGRPGLTELEARVLAARGARAATPALAALLGTPLMDLEAGGRRMADAILKRERIVVVADYDCDGATACAIAVAGLSAMGAAIGFVVPDRMVHGYGISPSVVDLARERYPDARVLMTVDNGILGHAGVLHAASLGIDVVVTDHHLPGDTLPDAVAVIDPSRADCPSGLPKLAGCGVALWLVVMVKKLLTQTGRETPKLNFLLPYIAIGTVADMVGLDAANRTLVSAGLDAIRLGYAPAGIAALLKEADIPAAYLTTQDIGFGLGPRINAAGRLDTMDAGIELLLTADPRRAAELARLLTQTNEARKQLQKAATDEASLTVDFTFSEDMRAIVRGNADWHPGIVGLVASRLKDTYHRPTFVFSLADGVAKGSGRSIPGFHLKDALEEVARRAPGLLAKFGGHAMAAGATLTRVEALAAFEAAFTDVARERITPVMLDNTLYSDGPMPDMTLEQAARLLRHPWGQGFEAPAFDDSAVIDAVKPMGKDGVHWKVQARVGGREHRTEVVLFNQPEPATGQELQLYLQPGLNTWNRQTKLQWLGRLLH
ncbi:single-stranded-DNA-specific exonuclease RecJ [Burkholderia ambifaria]|uniref:single-stranded-DNA-specific exonuclease RecJ n=1 Tax=Burkholderia ambifaria TaxID=152480 RepID=UPI0013DE9432|nr:DHHA1 domain-containing protein [Burkholderia ambifaria]